MAATRSNKSLIEEIEATAAARGLEAPSTKDLKNPELVELLASLQEPSSEDDPPAPGLEDEAAAKAAAEREAAAKVKADNAQAAAEARARAEREAKQAAAKAKAEADAARAARPVSYVVQPGRSVTTRIGRQMAEGTPVTADMFDGGAKTLELLEAKGTIGKV